MAVSIAAVAPIWNAAPATQASQNFALGCSVSPGVSDTAMSANTAANGRPNRKRTRVAPQGPAPPMIERCAALRATWKTVATMVMGIQIMF
jgi:hypothetical protein